MAYRADEGNELWNGVKSKDASVTSLEHPIILHGSSHFKSAVPLLVKGKEMIST